MRPAPSSKATSHGDETERRNQLAHLIVHDLRNDAGAAQGLLDLVARGRYGKIPAEASRAVQETTLVLNSMLDTFTSLLNAYELENGGTIPDLEPFDAEKLVASAIASLGYVPALKEIRIESHVAPAQVLCQGDMIRRVLAHLLTNAIRFAPRGSTIDVDVSPKGKRVVFAVQDDAHPVPPEQVEHLFTTYGRLETRRHGQDFSSGAGLSFCRLVVEAHGGSIAVHCGEERGRTFTFDLPAEKVSP